MITDNKHDMNKSRLFSRITSIRSVMTEHKPRRRILGIGYPRFAVREWEDLAKNYDVHHFVPASDRAAVVVEVKRLCDEHGPFDAGYVVGNWLDYYLG